MVNDNKTIVITGACGGLGSTFANSLAGKASRMLLIDRDREQLNELAEQLKNKHNVHADIRACNFADDSDIHALTGYLAQLDLVDLLVNCAGYSENKLFHRERIEDALQMISVHVNATVRLVHAVLPKMIANEHGSIITISSLAAFLPAPGSSIYAATKAFLNSFKESLHMEVEQYGIRTQALCPGLTHTGFHAKTEGAIEVPFVDLWMEAEEVVEHSLRDLEKGQVVSVPGFVNKSIKHTVPVLPRKFYYRLAEKIR